MTTTVTTPYEPVADICERLFGYRPNSVSICRWHSSGSNGKRLRVAKVAGRILSKESYVIEYFERGGGDEGASDNATTQPKTRSEAARKKAADAASAELDSMGI